MHALSLTHNQRELLDDIATNKNDHSVQPIQHYNFPKTHCSTQGKNQYRRFNCKSYDEYPFIKYSVQHNAI